MKKDFHALMRRIGSASFKRMGQNIDIIHGETGVSKAYLLFDMLRCTAVYNIGYLDYRVFGFAENRDPANRRTYMTMHHNSVLSKKLNNRDAIGVFIDKPRFNKRFADFLGRDYILLDECTVDDFCRFCKGRDSVFAKVTDSFGGQGLEKVALTEDTDCHELYQRLLSEHKTLVEETIRQHPVMESLCPGSVNTLRVVTVLKDGEPHFVYALLRAGNGKNSFDNITTGGMYALIDKNDVISKRAFCDKKSAYYETHPVSGVRFADFKIPFYKEAIALCMKAATVEPRVGYVGWDVAITEKGPLLVEGNHLPSYDLCQNHGLNNSKTGYLPIFTEILGEDFFR